MSNPTWLSDKQPAFRPGQRVRCLDDTDSDGKLANGREEIVSSAKGGYIGLASDYIPNVPGWVGWRFVLVDDPPTCRECQRLRGELESESRLQIVQRVTIKEKMDEVERLRRLAPMCDEHGSGTGTRSGCPYCALTEFEATLSRIDYLCGAPNEHELSLYDMDRNAERVVRRVDRLRERIAELEKQIESLQHPADDVYLCGCRIVASRKMQAFCPVHLKPLKGPTP